MKTVWFDWRNLRRPKRPQLDLPAVSTAPRLRLAPKKRPLWARFGRKPSPFDLRPGAVESWMKARPTSSRPALDAARRRDGSDRGDIGGGR